MQNITCNNSTVTHSVTLFGPNASRGSFVMDGQIIMQPGAIAWVGDTEVKNTSSRTMIGKLTVKDNVITFIEYGTGKVQIKTCESKNNKKIGLI